MLVTALEAQSKNVPKSELVTERLQHEELKLREKAPTHTEDSQKALVSNQKNSKRKVKQFTCHFCKKPPKWLNSTEYELQLNTCRSSASRRMESVEYSP